MFRDYFTVLLVVNLGKSGCMKTAQALFCKGQHLDCLYCDETWSFAAVHGPLINMAYPISMALRLINAHDVRGIRFVFLLVVLSPSCAVFITHAISWIVALSLH